MLALIIWGTRTSDKVMGTGDFHCPRCQGSRPYAQKKRRRMFALYWIPLFPVATIAEWVECSVCGGTFDLAVLSAQPQLPPGGQAQQWPQQPGGHPQGPQQGGPPQGGGGGWGR